jgi:aspartyl-tRNA(Asn)/glutamyl-tRNA(Gln) amidotransferase subunit A
VNAEDRVAEALERLADRADLNAVITLCADEAMARARAGVEGRLAGVPLLVKDLIDTAGIRTTYASAIYRDHVPTETAPAVRALEAEGAIVVGKANADEFAWGVCGQNVHYGDVVNPVAPDRIAGGSSSGNAAAVAAGLVPLGLGTDTGGSLRMPAAACGVVGLKPAHGAVPVGGVFPLVPSFDTVGPIARTVADAALAYAVLSGTPVPEPRLKGLRVGVLTEHPELTPDATAATPRERGSARADRLRATVASRDERAVVPADRPRATVGTRDERALVHADRLRALGAHVVQARLPVPAADLWPVFYAEAAAAHAATFPSRRDEYGPGIRAKLDHAATITPEQAAAARAALHEWRAQAAREPAVDLLLSPTIGVTELPPAGADELAVRIPFSAYTRVFNFLGWPAVAIGNLQLAGRETEAVIAAALAIEADAEVRSQPL